MILVHSERLEQVLPEISKSKFLVKNGLGVVVEILKQFYHMYETDVFSLTPLFKGSENLELYILWAKNDNFVELGTPSLCSAHLKNISCRNIY